VVRTVAEILIAEPLMPLEDLARVFKWIKEQKFPIHPDAAPIIEGFIDEGEEQEH
jgi:threonine aldolase